MGIPAVGDIVVVPFSFSDGSAVKMRPALIVAAADHRDAIVCQLTSRAYSSKQAIAITEVDFAAGRLPLDSFVRPEKLFTASYSSIGDTLAVLHPSTIASVRNTIAKLFTD
ncbi:type II toxin-antitoxin system PemK/MazF family toxin [Rathayibacter soli]|uniref:type II toxin-antitoxin system PemK/MazF family toxin n=1 Tax=Rathayibacter soli TaxID=3144168 RepID=UPI0027E4B682|nr:type II toxin-antitoxin system PemK/MazF family toxin [Glaciibacter superstes]